jgi:hypothetical protein
MISFSENPNAFGNWAKSHASPVDGLDVLAGPLRDGTWRHAPDVWVEHFSWSGFWGRASRSEALNLRRELIEAILGGGLDDAAHAALPGLFELNSTDAPVAEAARLTQWLVRNAGPNDAKLVADLVETLVHSRDEALLGACFPLLTWLLTSGSSELRSARRAFLVTRMLPLVVRFGTDGQVAATIRYVLYNDSRVGADGWGTQTIENLLPAIERLLVTPGAGGIVGDLLEALDATYIEGYIRYVLRGWQQFAASRAEVVRRLAHGEVKPQDPAETWSLAMVGPPVPIELGSPGIARESVAGLGRASKPHLRTANPSEAASLTMWSEMIATEFLRTTNVLRTRDPDDVRALQQCIGWNEATTAGVSTAVRRAVEHADDPGLDRMLKMLSSPEVTPLVVSPALDLLITPSPSSIATATPKNLDHVLAAIDEVIGANNAAFCGFSFQEQLPGVTHAEFAELRDGKAFVVEAPTLKLSRDDLGRVCGVSADPEVQRALGVLYVLHEVVHAFQGAAGMHRVAEIRFAGAESALMHIDLGADHIAATMTNSIFPQWDLLWLKDWQGQSIRGFPPGARNPPYSRIRKTLRLVGLRTDFALRRLGIGANHLATPESYGFADFSPGGGSFVALVNHPPFVVVKTARLSEAEAGVLFEGIDGNVGAIERVDEVIETLLKQ